MKQERQSLKHGLWKYKKEKKEANKEKDDSEILKRS